MKKIAVITSISTLCILVLLSKPTTLYADGTCPADYPSSTCGGMQPPNPSLCINHAQCGLTGGHFCCKASKVNSSCSVSNQTADGFTFCTGGFVTKAELREHTIFLIGQDPGSVCRQDVSLGSTPDSQIVQGADGYYYTCYDFSGLIGDCRNNHVYVAKSFTQPLCGKVNVISGTGSTIPVYDPGCTITTFIQGGRTRVDTQGVKTALGCLPVNPQNFVDIAIPWTIGIGAGIAFLLGIFGSMMIVLSAGNPEKMQAGKEMITSAIAGTIIIIFAVFLLDFIGVKVLKLFSF